MTVGEFWERVMFVCVKFDCSVTSGPRTDARNAHVGGSPGSRHRLVRGGKAADVVPDENTPARRKQVFEYAVELGLWALDETDHVHLDGR